ncbi:MAG: hypothetical protein EA365_13675 [Gloeocapsa sp. DLM2.Bin57]|nr:MAG: hypothetical protein EA365_13675 [Gloeocapsa sp. DLM2.Bin57]
MAILIANIGTSDLAVKRPEGFLPIGFDRNERCIDYNDLTDQEKTFWSNREQNILELCSKTKLNSIIEKNGKKLLSFRILTHRILEIYQQEDKVEALSELISPVRILGVIQKAYHEFDVRKAYLFVTNQEPEQEQDTIYLFAILKIWLNRDLPDLELIKVELPKSFQPIDQDALLNYYYNFFLDLQTTITADEVILVNTKGGTPQMQNALKLQSVAIGKQKLLFIDPILSIKQIIAGQPPQCNLTSYWQYLRQQKYQTVQQLLKRWDFDGAIDILDSWQKVLSFLQSHQVIDVEKVSKSNELVKAVISVLNTGRSLLDCDVEAGRKSLNQLPEAYINQVTKIQEFISPEKYDNIFNLYTQIMIYCELNKVGNILTVLASFYDVVLTELIKLSGGNKYLNNYDKLKLEFLKQDLGEDFYQQNLNVINQLNSRKILDSYSKKQFIGLLVKYRQENKNLQDLDNWEQELIPLPEGTLPRRDQQVKGLKGLLRTLDYWMDQRNQLIHEGRGFAIDSISELNQIRSNTGCAYESIPEVLQIIMNHPLLKLKNYYKKQFINTKQYYIYSEVRDWAITHLLEDLKN